MTDPLLPDSDLSPTLGGARARAEEPIAEPTGPAMPDPTPVTGMPLNDPLGIRSELEEIFGAEGAEVIDALTQLTGFSQGLSTLFSSTLQALETQLPQAFAAFEGLVDAVGQAVDQAIEASQQDDGQA